MHALPRKYNAEMHIDMLTRRHIVNDQRETETEKNTMYSAL